MTNKINGINVSEEIRYCNNCSNLGLDFKTGKFYCGLSNRKDELPEILSCKNFSSNCYIKRLQKENEELKKRQITKNGFICDCEQNTKYKQALEEIRHFIQVFVPKKEADYNSAKKEHPNFFGLLEQIKYHCNEVLNDRD